MTLNSQQVSSGCNSFIQLCCIARSNRFSSQQMRECLCCTLLCPVSSSESNIESSFEMPDWMASMHWMHYLMGSCGVSRGMLHDASVGQQSGKPDNMDPCSDLKVFLNPCFCDRHSHKDVILRTEYTIRCHSAQTFCNVFDRLSKVRIELSTFITSLL